MVRQTEDDFLASVYTVSSRTVIDELALSDAMSDLDSCFDLLSRTRVCCEQAQEAIYSNGELWGCEYRALDQICALVDHAAAQRLELEALRENIGMTLLIYYAAERRSEEFFDLRLRLFPSVRSAFEWDAEASQDRLWFIAPMSYGSGRHGLKFNNYGGVAGAQAGLGFIPFATGKGGDKVELLTQTFHVNNFANSRLPIVDNFPLRRHRAKFPDSRFLVSNGRGSWWSGVPTRVPERSRELAGIMGAMNLLVVGRHVQTGFVAHVENAKGERSWISREIPASSLCNVGAGVSELARGARRQDVSAERQRRYGFGPEVHETATPYRPSDLLDRVGNLAESKEFGQFEILRHDTPGVDGQNHRSWSVVIRGTQKWGIGETNPQDLLTNFRVNGAMNNDQKVLIEQALQDAGIGEGEPVEFVGHSQGAGVAVQLASDPAITERYEVASVLTAGGISGNYAPQTSVGTLNIENLRDLVPAIDGASANADQGGGATVYFDSQAMGIADENGQQPFAHDLGVYAEAVRRLETSGDVRVASVTTWVQEREKALHLTQDTQTTSMTFSTLRTFEGGVLGQRQP